VPLSAGHAHPPLIDAITWERAQQPNPPTMSTGCNAPSLLRGLARCAGYSTPLRIIHATRGIFYRCGRIHAAGRCTAPAGVSAPNLDRYEAFFKLLARRRSAPTGAAELAKRRLDQAAADLVSYRDDDRIRNTLEEDAFIAGLHAGNERVRDARVAYGAARTRLATHDLPPLAQLQHTWHRVDVAGQRDLLDQMIACVFVAEGPPTERVTLCPDWHRSANLPRLGRDRYTTTCPVKPRRSWLNPVPARLESWSALCRRGSGAHRPAVMRPPAALGPLARLPRFG
jgi:hypothetical protein